MDEEMTNRQPFNPNGVHSMIVTDIYHYGGRSGEMQKHVRRSHDEILDKALRAAVGVALRDCYIENRGDGAVVITPKVVTPQLVGPFVTELNAILRRYNKTANDDASIRIRVVVHEGRVERVGLGLSSPDLVLACRLVDADQVKDFLCDSDAAMVYVASQHVFDSVIQHAPESVDPDDFRQVKVENKETVTWCWVLLRGRIRPRPTSISAKQFDQVPRARLSVIDTASGCDALTRHDLQSNVKRKAVIAAVSALMVLAVIGIGLIYSTRDSNGESVPMETGQRVSIDRRNDGIVPRCARISGFLAKGVGQGSLFFAWRQINGKTWFLSKIAADNESGQWLAPAWFGGPEGYEGLDFEIVVINLTKDEIRRLPSSMKLTDLPDGSRYSDSIIVTRDDNPSPGVCTRFL